MAAKVSAQIAEQACGARNAHRNFQQRFWSSAVSCGAQLTGEVERRPSSASPETAIRDGKVCRLSQPAQLRRIRWSSASNGSCLRRFVGTISIRSVSPTSDYIPPSSHPKCRFYARPRRSFAWKWIRLRIVNNSIPMLGKPVLWSPKEGAAPCYDLCFCLA